MPGIKENSWFGNANFCSKTDGRKQPSGHEVDHNTEGRYLVLRYTYSAAKSAKAVRAGPWSATRPGTWELGWRSRKP